MIPRAPTTHIVPLQEPREMNRIFCSIAGLALAAATPAFLLGCHGSASADLQHAASPLRVTAARPLRKTLRLESVQPGQIEAFEQTPLFAKLPAYVEKLYVDIGDRVEEGKPVADLSIPELHDEARQKDAMVLFAKAGVRQATAAVRAAEKAIDTAEAGLREAKAGTIRALGQYERWKSSMRGLWSWRPARTSTAGSWTKPKTN